MNTPRPLNKTRYATPLALWVAGIILCLLCPAAEGGSQPDDRWSLNGYFKNEIARISAASLSNLTSLATWQARRPELRREAAEMLGLDPMPQRTDLQPVITGRIEKDDFTVEKLVFQSRPHLYVTANLYLPKPLSGPAPAVLYLCGHLEVMTNGVSYGNKVAYQHHGIWFARNGYVCLILDTLQLGEIPGHHRGTFSEGAWWWNSRGYTPAGVETWNAIRGLDYLGSRPEVDASRIGVTGRSGGGAYSWFLAALDDRVKVVAPVAGITDLENYCVDGTVDDHCDCMFLVNSYRWDYPLLTALCAPRPLLMANTDADEYFPFTGVVRTRNVLKQVYDLYGAGANFGLVIAPGPHKDIQDLQVPVFRWFNIHLKHEDPPISMAAVKMFAPQELKVLDHIPADQINTTIQDSFVPMAKPEIPSTPQAWERMKAAWMKDLREKCFSGWPVEAGISSLNPTVNTTMDGIRYNTYCVQNNFESPIPNALVNVVSPASGGRVKRLVVRVIEFSQLGPPSIDAQPDDHFNNMWRNFGLPTSDSNLMTEVRDGSVARAVLVVMRGQLAQGGSHGDQTPVRRRFMLIGQTLDGMRVWDIRRGLQALRSLKGLGDVPVSIEADGTIGVNALYASLFEPGISELHLRYIPASHMEGPDYLNVLKYLDIPQAAAMAAERCELHLQPEKPAGWDYLRAMAASPVAKLNVIWAN